jgi:hypothetical protein
MHDAHEQQVTLGIISNSSNKNRDDQNYSSARSQNNHKLNIIKQSQRNIIIT